MKYTQNHFRWLRRAGAEINKENSDITGIDDFTGTGGNKENCDIIETGDITQVSGMHVQLQEEV